MALEQNEIKKVISVDLGNTTTSLKDYKKHIDDLRGSLLQLDESSEEYAKISNEIKAEQDKLNEVMKVGKKNTDAADGSYDKLVQTMSELKKQWRATADETERNDIGKQILGINNQLKELDASTGNYQRNVGDYANSFKAAFSSLPGPIGNVSKGVAGLGTKLKALLANPVAAIAGAVTAAITVLTKSIKGNEEQMMALKEAFAVFEPVINVVRNAITKFAQGVVDVFTKVSETVTNFVSWVGRQARNLGFDELADKISKFEAMQAETRALAKEENELTKQKRDLERDIASTQTKISELKLKANKSDIYTAAERKKFLEEANRLEIDAAQKTITLRQKEYDIIKRRNELSQNSTKDYEAENQALIAISDAQTNLNNKLAGTERRISSLSKTITSTVNETQRAIETIDISGLKLVEAPDEVKLSLEAAYGQYKDKMKDIKEQAKHDETMLSLVSDTMDAGDVLDQEYQIQQERIRMSIAANSEILQNDQLTAEQRQDILRQTDELKAELLQNDRNYARERQKLDSDSAKKSKEEWLATYNSISSAASNLFGSMSDLFEEGSEEQKAFSIMQTVLNTLQAIMATWAGYAEMGPWGVAAAAVQTAALVATGTATIAKMKSTTMDSSASVAAPQASTSPTMTSVSPLLDEQADINRLDAGRMTGDQTQQNMKVYVVEQDIRDAGARVNVREANATF